MGNTAKIAEQELSPEVEKWLEETVAPIAADILSGKLQCMPLHEAYERGLKLLAEAKVEAQN